MRYRIETGSNAIGVADNRLSAPHGSYDMTLRAEGELRPGLINAHDHLHRNHYPRLGSPTYPDAYAWGRDLHERFPDEIARARALPRRDALLFGALKNLLGGVTTAVHHDAWELDFEHDFPLDVVRLRTLHSPGFDREAVAAAAAAPRHADEPFAIHLAEGVNAAAADEIRLLDRLGLLHDRLIAVHAVGADDDGVQRLRSANASVAWCPTSNHFLFGRTCPPALLDAVDVMLGTDALLTGAGTMLDELRAARSLGLLSDDRLEDAVGAVAARRLGLRRRALAPGDRASFVLLRRHLFACSTGDVALVIVNGRPCLGDVEFDPLFHALHIPTDTIIAGGIEKLLVQPLATLAGRVIEQWPGAGRIFAETPVLTNNRHIIC